MYTYTERAAEKTIRATELAAALEGKLHRLQDRHGKNLCIIGPDGPERTMTIHVDGALTRGNVFVAHGQWGSSPAKNAQFDLHHPTPATVDDLETLLAMVTYFV